MRTLWVHCLFMSVGVLTALTATANNKKKDACLPGGDSIIPATTYAADTLISGIVKNAKEEPMEGATVMLKTTGRSVLTNGKGEFSILAGEKDTLVISYAGYETKETAIGGSRIFAVTLNTAGENLSDVVVVAFGTQKKSEVVGSVTQIKPEELKIPSSNLTTALAGRVPGMIAVQRTGEPGADNAEFYIRGITTFGYGRGPLILIDGIESTSNDLARINVDDIASFNIYKDATATALYGSRAANGVISISTKEGKRGKAQISLRAETNLSMNTRDVELADPVTYMKLNNEAILTRNPLAPVLYSDEKIDNTVVGSGSYIFPSTDWRKELFKDQTLNQRLNMSVSGGGDVAKYYVGGTFTQDNGLLKVDPRNNFNNNINFKTYSLRSNVNMFVSPTTEMIVRLSGVFEDYNGPIYSGGDMYTRVMRANPALFPAYYPKDSAHRFVNHIMFGNYGNGDYLNPYADMIRGYQDRGRSKVGAQLELKQDLKGITPGLKVRGRISTDRHAYFTITRQYLPFYYGLSNYNLREGTYNTYLINEEKGRETLDYDEGTKEINSTIYGEAAIDYYRTFNTKHTLSGMLIGYLQERLNPNAGSIQESLPFRNIGLSGRATYGFANRYHIEFNFGYNGSERFYKTQRWGLFPSAGIAWTVSNEPFFETIKDKVNLLKFRATYGYAGKDDIGDAKDRFFYLSEVNLSNPSYGSVFGRDNGYSRPGVSISRYSDPNITWETSRDANIAIELGLLNKLNLIAEYYRRNRYNILQQRASTPASMGLWAQPQTNIGEVTGQGVDVDLSFNHTFANSMFIQAMANFTYASAKYKVFEEYEYPGAWWRSKIGYPINQQWGYIAQSLFADEAEVANSPVQGFGQYMAGDIKYKDVNGDGRITELDMVPLGYPTTPEIVYGFGLSFGNKHFDFQAFFQGAGRTSFWINPEATAPFNSYYYNDAERTSGVQYVNQLLQAYADSYWSEDNRNLYALWPRLSTFPIANNTQTSTWFMRNGAFLRLKHVEIGYKLPANWISRIGMKSARIYVSGMNLYTWSKFKIWDIEMGGNGLRYPNQKVYNLGLLVDF
ncbi:SusC/RagA family TonB-linked outer membrane protein [Niabella beijingensis]|uniref:SusC/RagA family TonB-linked outer membrane protein n=1 Tax=Niabella beijingensis TaxID=2872700 RepID=UPI001CBDFBA4|nr:TonB-dependent receptor [Niabella beijingensis]